MEPEPTIQHWLVTVARAAKLEGSDTLNVASDVELTAAWDAVGVGTRSSAQELAELIARHYRLEVADLDGAHPHAQKLIPAVVARKLHVLPLRHSDRDLYVATADPVSLGAEGELHKISARNVHSLVAPPRAIEEAILTAYPSDDEPTHAVPPLALPEQSVLVVDDDESMRLLLRTALEADGFGVIEAADGPEALRVIERGDPISLVTLDLQMEEMHGLDVLKKIRSKMSTATLPVIVATGADDPDVEMELFETGADDYVVKPVDPPRFLLRVHAVLRRRSNNPLAGLF